MHKIKFENPEYLYLLIIIIPMIVWYILKDKNNHASIRISTLAAFDSTKKTLKNYIRHSLIILRILAIATLVIAIARPQSRNDKRNVSTEGIDIVLALDISSSMLARDFEPDRLEASKDIATQFISGRKDDKIGLVVFGGESFTQCPLTTDHKVLINLFQDIQCGIIEDGTAIGLGLANAVNRLKESKAKSKVVVLITDGENNRGEIAPLTAAELAKTFGIRVYTVGIGSIGTAPYPFQTPFGISMRNVPVKIDEEVLQNISNITDGKYFRATDNEKLKQIYTEIDKLEKTKIEVKQFVTKKEEYLIFVIFAMAFVLLEILLRSTILRNIP
ncbi:MAG: VWA domain-containing protein [Marinifilaceae bacterium]|jgi:Ca-activated chloride channel family protein|nr:VWA domain-containing protein [Marinifilaceae bacterium]